MNFCDKRKSVKTIALKTKNFKKKMKYYLKRRKNNSNNIKNTYREYSVRD